MLSCCMCFSSVEFQSLYRNSLFTCVITAFDCWWKFPMNKKNTQTPRMLHGYPTYNTMMPTPPVFPPHLLPLPPLPKWLLTCLSSCAFILNGGGPQRRVVMGKPRLWLACGCECPVVAAGLWLWLPMASSVYDKYMTNI